MLRVRSLTDERYTLSMAWNRLFPSLLNKLSPRRTLWQTVASVATIAAACRSVAVTADGPFRWTLLMLLCPLKVTVGTDNGGVGEFLFLFFPKLASETSKRSLNLLVFRTFILLALVLVVPFLLCPFIFSM